MKQQPNIKYSEFINQLNTDFTLSKEFVDGLPPKMRCAIIKAEAAKQAERVKQKIAEKERLIELIGEEGLFRFGYVPYVIAKLAWDYADTVLLVSSGLKLQNNRKLSRTIRDLQQQYDNIDHYYNEDRYHDNEVENMLIYEDAVKGIFYTYSVNLQCELTKRYPQLDTEYRGLILAVYQCHITVEALLRYAAKQEKIIAQIVGHPIGRIIPKPVKDLGKVIMEFVADKPMSPKFKALEQTYIDTFANQIGLIEFTLTK